MTLKFAIVSAIIMDHFRQEGQFRGSVGSLGANSTRFSFLGWGVGDSRCESSWPVDSTFWDERGGDSTPERCEGSSILERREPSALWVCTGRVDFEEKL